MGSFYYDQSQVTQQITFSQGFGFVSSRISPDNPDMMEVVAEIINDDLVYIRNSTGAMLRKIGTNWVNGIGDWIVTEGYLIKINAAGQFTIGGTLIPQDTPIEILAGFQFVSYLPPNEMDAIEAFSSIISDDLLYIRNSEGNMLRKIGPNWVNGIGNCIPTEGYLVKLSADATLIYPNTKKSNNITKTFPKHFIFENGNPAEAVYTLYLEGLEIGDEVAAFDGDKMVGATRINSQKDFENELPVFSTLINGQGYEAGNPITLKVWSENKIIPADFTIEAIYDSYVSDVYPDEDGKYSVVNITKGTIENTVETISVYPNPSTGVFNISIEGIIGDISIKVFDLRGKVFSNFELKGSISTQLDLTELATGVYFISFISKDCSKVRRIVIK